MTNETWLEELAPEVCLHLLGTAELGRLGVVVNGHPEIFPVNHVLDERSGLLVFPSNHRTKFRAAFESGPVCLEVDGVDTGGRSAWSVVVVGGVEAVTDPELIDRVRAARRPIWAVDERTAWVAIRPTRITGRRISTLPD